MICSPNKSGPKTVRGTPDSTSVYLEKLPSTTMRWFVFLNVTDPNESFFSQCRSALVSPEVLCGTVSNVFKKSIRLLWYCHCGNEI